MTLLSLAGRSLYNRRSTVALTVVAIAVSVTLLLGVETLRREARASFASTVSGTDLVVGARSGSIQLLLYAVFRLGNATNNITWQSYQTLAELPEVAWTIPLSLGDSHRGFRVLGTNDDYFRHYRYGRRQPLELAAGEVFDDVFDAVLGAEVADALDYRLGDAIIINHGLGTAALAEHDDKPFRVVGILERTGTPVDRTLHVSLAGIEAIHVDWRQGVRLPGASVSAEEVRTMDLTPRAITAFLVGLESRLVAFRVQRFINNFREEPLLAILPGVALQELWSLMGTAELALLAIAVLAVVSGMIGMLAVILASLAERRRELAILRAVGARPRHIVTLLMLEAGLLALAGALLGLVLLFILVIALRPWLQSDFGLALGLPWPGLREAVILAAIIIGGFLAGILPAWRAYRQSVADGLTPRL